MSQEKKISKKKWIIVLSILVLIAIGVTFAIVFWPKDKSKVLKETTTQVQTMFLATAEDEQNFSEFVAKLNQSSELKKRYQQDEENIHQICKDLTTIIDFHSFNLCYIQTNKQFDKNYSKILQGYSHANHAKNDLQKLLAESKRIQMLDSSFIIGAWKEFREYFLAYLNGFKDAIEGLGEVFKYCMPKALAVNDLSFFAVDTINDYLQVISQNYQQSIGKDNADQYSNALKPKVDNFNQFLGYFKQDNTLFRSYSYSENVQLQTQKLYKFSDVYQKSAQDVIQSTTAEGFEFTKAETDTEDVLEALTGFLKGALK